MWEILANAFNAASILLATANSVHLWWTGIVGCALFVYVFFQAKLYADVTLQLFFIGASSVGWWRWKHGAGGAELPIRRTPVKLLVSLVGVAVAVAAGYAALLYRFTDAYAPLVDSVVLTFSVLAQFLLVGRRIENWWCWLLVNTLAVPLYFSRGLYVTAALYVVFWVNAIVALIRWRRLLDAQPIALTPPSSSIPA